ncbi:hypothetical protein O3297_09090 [Janthinobacterium sp. SUN128]|uniref:hypothetical protein n=1 Tax=Janthinobacterium sp. SUN128 TaxID=3014790 RepID=UPI002713126A|nr:hypothetical protein [Janthinobacterium sp. SUN128]MDO8033570.1 hypothetical protein [Janthinobacterium sp. SUN128]
MADFFYYGQKDTIRRLNELAGRGAVVASYAPAVGRSPLGGPNGYMNPAWLDPNLPIYTDVPMAVKAVGKFGYAFLHVGQGQRLYKIATLPPSGEGSYPSLRIDASIGGWVGGTVTAMTIIMGNRNAFSVDWSASLGVPSEARFIAYREADGSHSVYLFFLAGSYTQASFNLQGMGCTTFTSPGYVSFVPGTPVWDSGATFANSTYKSPRSVGMSALVSNQNGTSLDQLLEVRSKSGESIAASFLAGGQAPGIPAQTFVDALSFGISGSPGVNHPGCMRWSTSTYHANSSFATGYRTTLRAFDTVANTWTPSLFSVSGLGSVYMPLLKAGSTNNALVHNISRGTAEGDQILYVGTDAATYPSVWVAASNGQAGWSLSPAVLSTGKNSTTNRSINVSGTVNTNGNDYAEYIFKSPECGVVAPGQIVGITAENKVTDKWGDAVMFSIKSTAPSFVGGDSWGNDIGPRPLAQAGAAPTQPTRREDVLTQQAVPGTNPPEYEDVVTEPGDTDDEWAEKQAAYTAALAAHNAAVQQDAEAMATFDAALEVERQKVDRIAISGRVPVNVLGAQPGDYIVPVQDGADIKGIAVHEDELTMKQYLRAVGRVISIEPDGRAYVMVKVV